MFNSAFDTETNILHSRWKGTITKSDIYEYLDFLQEHKELPRHLFTLESMEDINVTFELEELMDVAHKMKAVLGEYKTIRAAVVSLQPIPVAYGMMYKSMTETFPNYKVEIFDSIPLALKWLEH